MRVEHARAHEARISHRWDRPAGLQPNLSSPVVLVGLEAVWRAYGNGTFSAGGV
jgi:hypothetical protein